MYEHIHQGSLLNRLLKLENLKILKLKENMTFYYFEKHKMLLNVGFRCICLLKNSEPYKECQNASLMHELLQAF